VTVSARGFGGLRTAGIFLTRVPLGDDPDQDLSAAVPWFPVVGAVVGLLAGGVYLGAAMVLPAAAAAALAVTVAALVTGAFHHDGLADMADAFGGGWDTEQRLHILKDSRHGTYGVMALVCAVVIQVAAIGALPGLVGLAALVAAHTLGRAAAVALMGILRPAAGHGLGVDYTTAARRGHILLAVGAGVGIGLLVLGPAAALCVLAAAAVVAVVGALAQRKIGGLVGDVLGAAEQVAETAVLLTVAALWQAGWLPWWVAG